MELGEREAKICRLCGQCESIYIDVFGEEGTKRFLGLKIYTKINILIKKNDGLPQIVCMRCLGTLEFMCDFQDSCQHTQKELLDAVQNETEDKLQQENDTESDKENAAPPTKHKPKALSPTGFINNSVIKNHDSKKVYRDGDDCTNGPATCTLVPLQNLMSNEQSTVRNIFAREKNPMNEQNVRTNLISKKDSIMMETNLVNLLRKDETNVNESSVFPVRRKRGRKSKLEKMREALLRKENNDSDNKCKKYCLRNKNVNDVTNNVAPFRTQVEAVTVKKQVTLDVALNEIKNTSTDKDTIPDKRTQIKFCDESSKKPENSSTETEDNSMKSKAITVIVKQEKLEPEGVSPRQNERLSPLTWIPSTILKQENLMDNESKNETKQQKTELQNRATVIKSSLANEITDSTVIEKKLYIKTDVMNESTESDIESSLNKQLLLQHNQSSSCDEGKEQKKNKEKLLTKISHLISDEEKEAIEGCYTVNMSIVDSEEVQKHLTIIDKKNIRCNICGFLYLRMDKCQVHIWGHLQMKPYKCKACDFSTVTITNIRSHIRKSHLKLKPFSCNICEKRYYTAFSLDEHMNSHTGDRPFKCELCDFSTARSQLLSYHIATHKVLKEIHCKICGSEFSSRSKLRTHMLVHNRDKAVACKLCSAYLSNQESLEAHHTRMHMQDYICKICGKILKSKKALNNHKNVHTVGKYKCSLCPKVYKSGQILKEHLLKHKGIRSYKCAVCEKTFAQQSHLAAHMAVHSEIRFHCPGCDKPFNRHDNMKIHTKRCSSFLANPDLKNLFIKRERSSSLTRIAEMDDQVDLYEKAEEVTSSTEINVIQITEVSDKLLPESENFIVLENVLRPESF